MATARHSRSSILETRVFRYLSIPGHISHSYTVLLTCRFGKEANANGRVWKIYKDGMKQHDDGSFEAWKETLDVLLVFVRNSTALKKLNFS